MVEAILTSRDRILALLQAEPGLHLREVPRRIGLSLRAVRYHLDDLTRQGRVVAHRSGRYVRWFPGGSFTTAERLLISALRVGPQRMILARLGRNAARFSELEGATRILPASLARHLRHLTEVGLVMLGNDRRYRLLDPDAVRMRLALYRGRLPDALADATLAIFDGS